MSNNIESWAQLGLENLFYAYRKAKVDCFYEHITTVGRGILEYEEDLVNRLNSLLSILHAADTEKGKEELKSFLFDNFSRSKIVSKKLSSKPDGEEKSEGYSGHAFFSDADKRFNYLKGNNRLIPEFRVVGDFSVDLHILSSLWINLIGHKYDGCLTSSAYGNRLRRYRAEEDTPKGTLGNYHLEALGSFSPYFRPYKDWREKGLRTIRHELEKDEAIIALSLDIKSYYHNIDPSFMTDKQYLSKANIKLNEWEIEFTQFMVDAILYWAEHEGNKFTKGSAEKIGLPIGISIAHIIANAFLVELDRDIKEGLTPVFYGRYVDDIFLVIKDPENIRSSAEIFKFIGKRTTWFNEGEAGQEIITLRLPEYVGESKVELQQEKQKAFFLEGRGGLDLLDNIESEIRRVSSERRLMPCAGKLEKTASAKVLSAAAHPSDEADTLRKADGLTVRRLSWAVQLRAVEILARDLKKEDWREERNKFYEFARNHILRADKILENLDYTPRLLGIAIALSDWADASRLYTATVRSLRKIRDNQKPFQLICVNGKDVKGEELIESAWDGLMHTVRSNAREAILRSVNIREMHSAKVLPQAAKNLLNEVRIYGEIDANCEHEIFCSNDAEIKDKLLERAIEYRECDWAKMPYKEHLRKEAFKERGMLEGESDLSECYEYFDLLEQFLQTTKEEKRGDRLASRINKKIRENKSKNDSPSVIPYLFPTRAYSTQEISLYLPDECIFTTHSPESTSLSSLNVDQAWAQYVRAVRGIWVKDKLSYQGVLKARPRRSKKQKVYVEECELHDRVLLGITSFLTGDAVWRDGASGKTNLSRERYEKIEYLINQVVQLQPKPTHLLMPELSLPEEWLDTVSAFLMSEGISLIAGLDYTCHGDEIYSSAALVLSDNRLGFKSSVHIRQPKIQPAPSEKEVLQGKHGKKWKDFNEEASIKPIYYHRGLSFGTLVCSELQNVSHRKHFQGEVDCMMVLAWNRDLETFSALVEAASLDVHAYIALVNNRSYGDSRVRAPAKEAYQRDICRVRGGENEYVVVAELNIQSLRAFQSRAERFPKDDDPFKPVPEDFKISDGRETIPK